MGVSSEQRPHEAVKRGERSIASEGELQRAERLGSAWLQRYRRIEGSSLLPSVEPLNELLLGLDFFGDLREEDVRSVSSCATSTIKEASCTTEKKDDARPGGSDAETEDDQVDENDDTGSEGDEGVTSKGYGDHLRAIPTVIKNEDQYVGFFFPLFLQEAKQAIARAVKLDFGPAEEFVQVSSCIFGAYAICPKVMHAGIAPQNQVQGNNQGVLQCQK